MSTLSAKHSTARGFTLVEMLVVVFIIGLLSALVFPAIQAARARARQIECATRLADLGRAMIAYESANRYFPPAMRPDKPGVPRSSTYYGPHVFLLPYLDQQPLADRIDLRHKQPHVWNPTSKPLMDQPVASFLCPSDRSSAPGRPGNSYRASMGPGPYSVCNHLTPCEDGAFRAPYEHTAAQFRDGLDHTIAMSEKLIGGANPHSFDGRRDFWYSGVSSLPPLPRLPEMVRICSSLSGRPPHFYPYGGATWFLCGFEFTWYNHAVGPNSPSPDCAVEALDQYVISTNSNGGVFGPSSNHGRGVNCLFMSGAVKFIADPVDLDVWRALATRASGEVISDNQY